MPAYGRDFFLTKNYLKTEFRTIRLKTEFQKGRERTART
ncbi:Uncharacterized protein dnm_056390 [Desulfonema magnum]|uniref:Uncharacterized protein n=1 Tax=Desulfonema magnum TaxID=45655 RepID=A0A975BQL7_9BACT|nr:Uncharacterized protein dnm_056390 [Desulfonema magnum]